jgi:aldehyde dehydrogenase (NAD+)
MEAIVATLRKSFNSNVTRSYEWRKTQLQSLQRFIDENKKELCEAVRQDLNKHEHETITMELGVITNSITYALKNLHHWMQPQKVNPIIQARALYSFYMQAEPLGVVLIIGAWNYPLQLTLVPLVGALASGNCAILKPSELAVKTADLMEKLWPKYFDANLVSLVNGGIPETTDLLKQR